MHHGARKCFTALVVGLTTACSDPVAESFDAELELAADAAARPSAPGIGAGNQFISVLDDCDPTDPGWAPTGGCTLKSGAVQLAEFNLLLTSPLSSAAVGHPAWRHDPSFVTLAPRKQVRVQNDGGRFHTFTHVAEFGGGRVPPLNQGLTPAPECALAPGAPDPTGLAPGARLEVANLSPGIHRYMCCIHPWMRAVIEVTP
jgi:hypothetical protein